MRSKNQKILFYLFFLGSLLFPLFNFFMQDEFRVSSSQIHLKTANYPAGEVNYLIITNTLFLDALEPLTVWKTQKGLVSKIITVEDIDLDYIGRDTEEKIKNCIKEYYENNNTLWVLLAGDIEHIPSRFAHAPEWYLDDGDYVWCDSYYTDLDNNWDLNSDGNWSSYGDEYDYHAEVYVGRLSANSLSEMDLLVNNILKYEKNPSLGPWMTQGMHAGAFICFAEDWDDDGDPELLEGDRNQFGNYLASRIPQNWSYITLGETEGIRPTTHPYNMSLNTEHLENIINNGTGIGAIYAHGSPNALYRMIWEVDYDHDGLFDYNGSPYSGGTPYDIAIFPYLITMYDSTIKTQNDKLGFYYLLGCKNGQFDGVEDCLTEFFLKKTAIGCIGGNYLVWGEDNWTERADGGWYSEGLSTRFFDELFNCSRPGQALALAKEDYMKDRIVSGESAVEPMWENKTLKQFNLFGDPEVPIWLNIPKRLKLERIISENESKLSTLFKVSANNKTIENVTITITNGNNLIWVDKTNQSGIVKVPYAWDQISAYTITASKFQYLPDQIAHHGTEQNLILGFNILTIISICFISICVIIVNLRHSFLKEKK